jgi:hypothetical protein
MPNLGPFPSKEADLNTYLQVAVSYLKNNLPRLSPSAENMMKLDIGLEKWNSHYPASQNANMRTKSMIENKDIAKENILTLLRSIYADIPASTLTIEDRNTLNIAARNTARTPTPVPNTKPIGKIDTSRRLEHVISFTNENGSHAKPQGARGCQIWHKIGQPAIDPKELSYLVTSTASPYIHHFAGEHVGENVHYWLRWENTRGEVGPWSDVVMATVTG